MVHMQMYSGVGASSVTVPGGKVRDVKIQSMFHFPSCACWCGAMSAPRKDLSLHDFHYGILGTLSNI